MRASVGRGKVKTIRQEYVTRLLPDPADPAERWHEGTKGRSGTKTLATSPKGARGDPQAFLTRSDPQRRLGRGRIGFGLGSF